MADILYSWKEQGYADPLSREQNRILQAPSKSRIKSLIIKALIVLFLTVLAAEIIFYVLILPARSNANIIISGGSELTSLEIKRIAGITDNTRWLAVNSSAVSKNLVLNPLIASATVEKKFPDKVLIKITERKPVAVAFTEIRGRTVPMEIDNTGVVFRIGNPSISKNLPVIGGLIFNNPRAGMQISSQLSAFFMGLDLLQKKQPLLLNEISEIKIREKRYGGYDLIVYPIRSQLSIITDRVLTEDGLRYMMLLVDVVRDLGLDSEISEIDIRGTNAVYKKRGTSSE